MGQFLNNKEPYDKFKTVMNGTYFVDKSEILEELIPALQQEQRFFCITRPRRFGKTVMANMIAAFFENTGEPSLFEHLHIAEYAGYKEQAGKHDVIYIDFSEMQRMSKLSGIYRPGTERTCQRYTGGISRTCY